MTAARLSVLMALGAVALGVTIGLILGTLPTLAPRWVGRMVVAFLNFAIAFPGLLLAIFLLVVLGQGAGSAVIAIGLALASPFARLTYALASSVNGRRLHRRSAHPRGYQAGAAVPPHSPQYP